ncbi:MAG TPA: helix-turn-helix domain-containing protein [Sphingobium sp.]|uniref:TetR/AcrR family transcriptional regulator n=1 Tax=Sphingobium sp. TaxID=1912891 RepID=UPI002ECFB427
MSEGKPRTRRRLDAEQSRTLILDAVERLMRREGHAAVNTRSVAAEAGVTAPLVHYHFETTENLLLAAYRRSAQRSEERLLVALDSERPLRAVWDFNADPERTALASQFMALANHRESIRLEMGRNVERFRTIQAASLSRVLGDRLPKDSGFAPEVVAMLIAAIGRAFVMEGSIGIASGHDGLRALVERYLAMIEDAPP